MSSHGEKSLIEAYGDACAALARAEERLALFPEPDVLLARIRFAEQRALAWLEGEDFMPDLLATDYGFSRRAWRQWPFLFVRAFDRPLPPVPAAGRPPALPGAAMVGQWLSGGARGGENARSDANDVAPADQPLPVIDDRLLSWERAVRLSLGPAASGTASPPLPALVLAADLAAHFVRVAPLLQGNPVIGAMLAERHALGASTLTAGGITAIGMRQRQTPWLRLCAGTADDAMDDLSEVARAARWRLAWLNALAAGADAITSLDKRLRLWLGALDAACAGTRKTSHLRKVVLLAARGPSLTVTRAAEELGLSRQAVTQIVAQACERRLLRETTHGNAFRRYVPAI